MTSKDDAVRNELNEPEAGATEQAIAMHGGQAREEKFAQPEATPLPADTLIATPGGYDPNTDDDEGDDEDDHI